MFSDTVPFFKQWEHITLLPLRKCMNTLGLLLHFFCFILLVNGLFSYLEDDVLVLEADVYITAPENFDLSDEDSSNEESTDINCLSRHQLLTEVELRAKVSVQQQESQKDELIPSTSQNPPPEKKCNRTIARKWRNVDIPHKRKEWTPHSFLEDFYKPFELFELLYDEEVIELQTDRPECKVRHVNFIVGSAEIKRFIDIRIPINRLISAPMSGYNGVGFVLEAKH